MIRISRAGLLSSALFLFIVFIVTPCFADFRFAVMGDSRGNEDGINTEILPRLLEQLKSDKPEFIIFVGDLITGSKHSDEHRRRLLKWKAIVEGYDIPVYVVVGNHEITSEKSEAVLESIFGDLTYSFNYENAHFVILDTAVYKNFHRIDETQLEWLKNNLKKNDKDIIYVFGHDPAYPVGHHTGDSLDKYPSERDKLWKTFQEYGVDVYFCGHEHLYNRSTHDDILQIITGGAGAHLHAPPEKGGFYHYVIVDVEDDAGFEVKVKDIDGDIKDHF